MQPYRYWPDGAGKREIGALTADGFRYLYSAQDTDMYAETYVLKKGKRCREKRRNSRKVTSGNSVTYT